MQKQLLLTGLEVGMTVENDGRTVENHDLKAAFVDMTGQQAPRLDDLWPSIVVPKADIDAEITRLAEIPGRTTAGAGR
jgi:hypothetical protein